MSKAKILKWGNSLAIRIPMPVAEKAGVAEGDPIVLEAVSGQIKLVRSVRVPSLKELVAQITRENRHEQIHSGPERGREIVEW